MIKSKIKNLNELTKGYANKNSNPLLYGGQPKTETQTYRMDISEYRKLVEKGEGTNEPMTCRKILPGEDFPNQTSTNLLGTKQGNPVFNICMGVWVGGPLS